MGSISRRADGRWRWRGYVDGPDGAPRRVELYGRDRAEVIEKAKGHLGGRAPVAAWNKASMTLATAVDVFLTRVAPELRPSSLATYRSTLRTHVLPHRGDVPVNKLSRASILDLYATLEREGASLRTIQAVHNALRRLINFGLTEGWIDPSKDPMAKLKRPGGSKQARVRTDDRIRYWTADEASAFLAAAWKVAPLRAPLFELLLGTGMRIGEALALRWRDVDLTSGRVTISRSVSKGGDIGPPKTEASHRTIKLGSALVDVLKAVKVKAPGKRDDLIFRTPTGRPLSQDNLRHREWKQSIEAAGVPYRSPHEARHTHATLILQAGTPAKVVSERLGHGDISVTLGTYQSVLPDMQGAAADLWDGLMAKKDTLALDVPA